MKNIVPSGSRDPATTPSSAAFMFLKGSENALALRDHQEFEWASAASKVREHLGEAMNARNVAFLLGSGCSSLVSGGTQIGVPTMKPMAEEFASTVGMDMDGPYPLAAEREALEQLLGIKLTDTEYAGNLERLMEVLFSAQVVLRRSKNAALKTASKTVDSVILKASRYVIQACTNGPFANGDDSVLGIYQSFYRKLVYRDRTLPRAWVFTTNYDLFNEIAMDRLSVPYCNGFSGTVERRFNPATFRYSLAEQLDITSRKWTAVDNFIYLCKLHGSINWVEEGSGLFPIREVSKASADSGRVMIYPTPAKQNVSFGSPYSDLFREFQHRIVRD